MSRRCETRSLLRLVTAAILLAVSIGVAFVLGLQPASPAVLILPLPLWAAGYAGFAVLYAVLATPPALTRGQSQSGRSEGTDTCR
jgi:hypothetical protein